jgi:hypothetical protein
MQRRDTRAASLSEQHFDDVVSIEAVLQSEGGAVEVKLPKMESDHVGGPCPEHAANTKPNLPCFKPPSLTEELIRIEHGWLCLSTRNLRTRYTQEPCV